MNESKNNLLTYKRVLIKLSGQSLAGQSEFGIESKTIQFFAHSLSELHNLGVEIGLVVGGGNFYRGAQLAQAGIERITADQIGMLGTIMNCLALRDALERFNMHTSVLSAIPIQGLVESYDRKKAKDDLSEGKIVLFAAGTGNPLFTTDTAASLRAIETNCELLIKLTNVDGIYDKDPKKFDDAKKIANMSFEEAIRSKIQVMDLSSFCQCQEHNIKIMVCNGMKAGVLKNIVTGDRSEGTLVS